MNDTAQRRNNRFKRKARILTPSQYREVFEKPHRASNRLFTILARQNNLGFPRLGLAISKKNVKLAVHRNRIKRIIREYFRLHVLNCELALDFVVMAKRNAHLHNNHQLLQSIEKNVRYLMKITNDR